MEKNKDQSDEPCALAECEIEASTGEIHWIQLENFICDVCEE